MELIAEGVFTDEKKVVESITPEAHTRQDVSATQSPPRSEYHTLGDRILRNSFTCEKNRAVAEQVSRAFAPDNHRLQLECMHNIRDFTIYPENTDKLHRAKQWLKQHDLIDLLWNAYIK